MPFKDLLALLRAEGRWSGELGARMADGRDITALSQWTLYRDPCSGQELVLQVHADITALKATEAALAATREEVRDYSQHLDAAVEQERLHIARELHDELGQRLTTLKLDVNWLAEHVDRSLSLESATLTRLRTMGRIIDDTIAETRALSASLRPIGLEVLGLKSALESMVKGFAARTGVLATVNIDAAAQVPVAHKLAVYRIVQEALTNVARHSRASAVEVLLGMVDGKVRVEVHDNGVGMAAAGDGRARLGLIGMRERALAIGADLEISSEDGTSIVLEVPR